MDAVMNKCTIYEPVNQWNTLWVNECIPQYSAEWTNWWINEWVCRIHTGFYYKCLPHMISLTNETLIEVHGACYINYSFTDIKLHVFDIQDI